MDKSDLSLTIQVVRSSEITQIMNHSLKVNYSIVKQY